MRRIRVWIVAAAVLFWWVQAAPAADPDFVAGIDDLPLMPELREVPGSGVVFDKPSGRIVEAYAVGAGVSPGEVAAFYPTTLPQLGWQHLSDLVYEREGERLSLTMTEGGDGLTLHFHLSPR